MPLAAASEAAPHVEVRDYLDMLAVALAAAATWWRQQLESCNRGLPIAQLDKFEGTLCFHLATLLLRNAQHGLSWRSWKVSCRQGPDEVLSSAQLTAGVNCRWLPLHYTRMWLETTADQVIILVQRPTDTKPVQVWPVAAPQ